MAELVVLVTNWMVVGSINNVGAKVLDVCAVVRVGDATADDDGAVNADVSD